MTFKIITTPAFSWTANCCRHSSPDKQKYRMYSLCHYIWKRIYGLVCGGSECQVSLRLCRWKQNASFQLCDARPATLSRERTQLHTETKLWKYESKTLFKSSFIFVYNLKYVWVHFVQSMVIMKISALSPYSPPKTLGTNFELNWSFQIEALFQGPLGS